jgi:acyl-coenzyme A synthetase/AMP-(fatty) acid ligase
VGNDAALVAFVVATGEAGPALRQALLQRLRSALPPYMVPTRLHFLARLPRLPGGKLDLRALSAHDDSTAAMPGMLARLRAPFRRQAR